MTFKFDWVPHNGFYEQLIDNEDGTFSTVYRSDVTDDIDANKRAMTAGSRKFGQEPGMFAWVPNAIIMQWIRDDGVDLFRMQGQELRAYLARKLNDPEWAYLKRMPLVI